MTVAFTVPGRPVPKKRPRVAYQGRRAVTYTPRETKDYEQAVGWAARPHFRQPLEGMVGVNLQFFVARKDRRGDIDNLAKSVLDGLNGIAFADDRQIVGLDINLHECPRGQERVEVRVFPIPEDACC